MCRLHLTLPRARLLPLALWEVFLWGNIYKCKCDVLSFPCFQRIFKSCEMNATVASSMKAFIRCRCRATEYIHITYIGAYYYRNKYGDEEETLLKLLVN